MALTCWIQRATNGRKLVRENSPTLEGKVLPLHMKSTILTLAAFVLSIMASLADVSLPGSSPPPDWLDYWMFTDTNTWADTYGTNAISWTNVVGSDLGDATAAFIDNPSGAWIQYPIYTAYSTNGYTNLTVDTGSVAMWFAPNWTSTNAGGTGPGQWGRLLEVGAYTTNASYGWWSLYIDPDGANIYFGAQTNDGSGISYLSAPIDWDITNRWHYIVLTYCSTNTSLYLDGQLATTGSGMSIWPSSNVLSNGFLVGSDSTGVAQARGMFDDLATYNFPLDASTIGANFFTYKIVYYMNPANPANLVSSGDFTPSSSPSYYNAITGSGSLQFVGSAATCTSDTNVWITNVTASVAGNGTVSVTFTIQGGTNGALYDVFGSSVLGFGTNYTWAWLGQGSQCDTYTITNLPFACFLILGTPLDSDGDGLTDAYENLVTHTDPHNADTDGDGIPDGWEVVLGLNALVNDSSQGGSRANYGYDGADWLRTLSGTRSGSVTLDAEGNVTAVSQ